jgi:hypothetical protein
MTAARVVEGEVAATGYGKGGYDELSYTPVAWTNSGRTWYVQGGLREPGRAEVTGCDNDIKLRTWDAPVCQIWADKYNLAAGEHTMIHFRGYNVSGCTLVSVRPDSTSEFSAPTAITDWWTENDRAHDFSTADLGFFENNTDRYMYMVCANPAYPWPTEHCSSPVITIHRATPAPATCSITNGGDTMYDGDTTVTWNVAGATSCQIHNGAGWVAADSTDGAHTVSANALAGGTWIDGKTFQIACTGSGGNCSGSTTVKKLCWCAGGPIRVSDVRATEADAINCRNQIDNPGGDCWNCATYGKCECQGRWPNWHTTADGKPECRCHNPPVGPTGSWVPGSKTTHALGACVAQ